jgi:hypothetical protein
LFSKENAQNVYGKKNPGRIDPAQNFPSVEDQIINKEGAGRHYEQQIKPNKSSTKLSQKNDKRCRNTCRTINGKAMTQQGSETYLLVLYS